MFNLPDLHGVLVLALIGMISIGIVALGSVAGMIYFIVYHVQIV